MARKNGGAGSGGDVALFKQLSNLLDHELLQTKGLQQGSLALGQSILAPGERVRHAIVRGNGDSSNRHEYGGADETVVTLQRRRARTHSKLGAG